MSRSGSFFFSLSKQGQRIQLSAIVEVIANLTGEAFEPLTCLELRKSRGYRSPLIALFGLVEME